MAGYLFAVSKDSWKTFCDENLKYGHFSPYTPEVNEEMMDPKKKRSRKSKNKTLAAIFGDMITMKPGDNVYFLSNRKIYGIGELVRLGEDCKYDNYLNSSALLPDCRTTLTDVLTISSTRARWVCFFKPSPYFFTKGADMDDVLRYRPTAFKMLRAFEGVTFIKIDDEENRALKEYISLINETSYNDIDKYSFKFSSKTHDKLCSHDLSSHKMDLNKALKNEENREFVISEMFVEASLLQAIHYGQCQPLGHWDHVTHQLIASPFKPLSYIDKIDIYGYKNSDHYQDSPKLITKYLIVELKLGKINAAALEQTMQYVDWVCSEYASGDYSRIEAYVVGDNAVRNIDDILHDKCQRDFIVETHPVKTQKWNNLKLLKYEITTHVDFKEYTKTPI